MTINSISSNSAATQATPHTAKHKPSVDFAKLMVNTADLKPDAATQQQDAAAVTPVPTTGGINTSV